MDDDLNELSFEQLTDLIERVRARMRAAKNEDIAAARKKIDALLTLHGVTLREVFPERGDRQRAIATLCRPPKYRNPANPAMRWSGLGRRPLWLVEALKHEGVTLEQLLL